MQLEEVYFNHDPASAAHDAMTICRAGGGAAIVAPEWKRGLPSQPAAYARDAISGAVTIRARFSGGPENATRKIRAVDPFAPQQQPAGGCQGCLSWLGAILTRAISGNILGDVGAQDVAFDGSGNSGVQTFTLVNPWLPQGFVSKRQTTWSWQVLENGVWTDFDTSQHTIYVTLTLPNAPWVQAGDLTQLPWVDALDLACEWAFLAKTPDEAAQKITNRVNRQSNESYTPITEFGFGDYYLESYMQHVASGVPFVMNCTDCADAVTTLSNLLGCTLAEGQFFTMQTRPFLTLAGNPANAADWVTFNWGYHEICWLNDFSSNTVWDGCLQLDMANALPHVAQLPVKMTFDSADPNCYKKRLIASGPGTLNSFVRHRRVV